jgi:hypothetical protein
MCKLNKALYSLKQAPRAWYSRFQAFITSIGFRASRCDNSLFIYTQGADMAYLVLYVDDIILAASSPRLLRHIIGSLQHEFAMTDLGHLHYFLGVSAQRSSIGLFLSQANMLLKFWTRQTCHLAILVKLRLRFTPSCPPKTGHRLPILHYIGVLLVLYNT